MLPAPSIRDEQARLQALRSFELLDTLPESSLDDLTAIAAQICGTPISLISLVDENRQWFKSRVGLEMGESPRNISFCGHAIAEKGLFVVGDAAKDRRFADSPLVTGDPNIRFYAAAPLVTPDGHAIGTLCVMDRVPRRLKPAQLEALEALGRQVMAQFELRRQSRTLSQNEMRMRAAVAAANVGLWDWNLESNTVWYSPEWKSLIGCEEHEISNRYEEWRSRVHPDDLGTAEARIAAYLATQSRVYENEFRFRHKDGTYRWILAKASLVRDAGGKPVRMLGSHVDVTERKRSEELLREREEQFRLYAEHSPAAVAMLDCDMRYLVASRRWMEDYGLGDQSIIGRSHYDVFPEIPERWREVHRRCVAGAVERCEEDPFVRSDGRTDWLRWEIRPWRKADGSIGGIIMFTENITARKEATAALERAHASLQSAQRISHTGSWEYLVADGSIKWSDELYRIFGLVPQSEPITYERLVSMIHPHDRARHDAYHARLLSAKPGATIDAFEYRLVRPDNEEVTVSVEVAFQFGPDGRLERMFGSVQDITARKQAEVELVESQQRFEALVQNSIQGVALVQDEHVVYANPAILEITGDSIEEMRDRSVADQFDRIHPDDRQRLVEKKARLDSGEITDSEDEFRFRRKDGEWRWVRAASRSFTLHGRPARLRMMIDITERMAAEEALRGSERQYRLLFASNPHPMWVYDVETLRFLAVNDAAISRYGYSREEFLAFTIKDIRPPEDLPRLMENLRTVTSTFQEAGVWRHKKKDGTVIDVEITSHLLVFDGRKAELVLAVDVTKRRLAEQHLEHLNRVYAVLSDINQTIVRENNAGAMINAACRIAVEKGGFRMAWIGLLDESGGCVKPAASAGVVDGYLDGLVITVTGVHASDGPTSHAIRTGSHMVCTDIETDPMFAPWRGRALSRGYRSSAAFPLKVEGRSVGTFNLYASEPDFFNERELQLLDELAADISFALEVSHRDEKRRRTEEELRWRTAFFEAQVDSALDGILVVDNEGRKIIQNHRFNEVWKIPPEVAENSDDRFQLDFAKARTKDPEGFASRVAHLYSHPDEVSQDIIELLDGSVLERLSAPVRGKSGVNYGRIWVFRDITSQRKLESQLIQSQKMEAIGQLAGGVAHDFNNILAAIMMQADLASSAGDMPSETREMLEEIKGASERAANLTRQLLAFSRRQVMQPRVLDLNEAVTNVAKMLQRILGEDIRLQFNLHPRPVLARADAGMIDQVLLNLVVNARDAMPDGGNLTINTSVVVLSEEQSASIPESTPGPHACVSVSDTGSGIAPEHLPRIFEPFFTTKEPGKGTGLGLATVFGIIKQHGGALKVESDVGRGTLIEFMLPAIDPAAEELGETSGAVAPRGGIETILLVEDDPAVRMLTRMVLESKGYKVIEAESGPSALKAWEQAGGAVDLLFTDLVMPEGIGGHALAAELQAHKPGLKVIFTSGYSADIAGRELDLKAGQNFIQKPCPPTAVLEIVRRSLDS